MPDASQAVQTIRELLGVVQVIDGNTWTRPCPAHLTQVMTIRVRSDAPVRATCPAGCREATLAAALHMDTETLLDIRLPAPRETRTETEAAPAAEPTTPNPKTEEQVLWEELRAAWGEVVRHKSVTEHLEELTLVTDEEMGFVPTVHADGTKRTKKEIDLQKIRTKKQVKLERNLPELNFFILRVAHAEASKRMGYLELAADRDLFPGLRLHDLKRRLAIWLNPPPGPDCDDVTVTDPVVLARLREEAKELLEAPDPLEKIKRELARLGYGGDPRPLIVLYVCWATRLLKPRRGSLPTHVQTNGGSGSGKTYSNDLVRDLHPPERYIEKTATSLKELINDRTSIRHKVLYFTQANSLPGASGAKAQSDEASSVAAFVLTLLQSGTATYSISLKDKDTGDFVSHTKVRQGPCTLVTTMVDRVAMKEMDSRLLPLDWPEDPTQQYDALMASADLEESDVEPTVRPVFHHYQRYLQALVPIDVHVPFIRAFNALLHESRSAKGADPRLLRDAARLKSLIKGVAILRSANRAKENGRIIATLDDYNTMVKLVEGMYEASTSVSAKQREVIECIPEGGALTVTQIAAKLGCSHQAVSQRIPPILKLGYLAYQLDAYTSRPTRSLERDQPLPSRCGLPSGAQIRAWVPKARRTPVQQGSIQPCGLAGQISQWNRCSRTSMAVSLVRLELVRLADGGGDETETFDTRTDAVAAAILVPLELVLHADDIGPDDIGHRECLPNTAKSGSPCGSPVAKERNHEQAIRCDMSARACNRVVTLST
jgi:hypothetical protein